MEKTYFPSSLAAAHAGLSPDDDPVSLGASFWCTADVTREQNTNKTQEQTKNSQYF